MGSRTEWMPRRLAIFTLLLYCLTRPAWAQSQDQTFVLVGAGDIASCKNPEAAETVKCGTGKRMAF
jgi:hypothetical protein